MRTLFAKFNRDRKKQFQIQTVIYENAEGKFVRKKALTKEACTHIAWLSENFSLIGNQNSNMKVLKGELHGDFITFPYIEGDTFSQLLVKTLKYNSKEAFLLKLNAFLDDLYTSPGTRFESYNAGEHISFINKETPDLADVYCIRPANLDMIFENIIIDSSSEQKIIIDSEWVFDDYIPVLFIFFRSVYSFWIKYATILTEDFIDLESLMMELGISGESYRLFLSIEEDYFQKYVYGDQISRFKLSQYKKNRLDFKQVKGLLDNNKYVIEAFNTNKVNILSTERTSSSDIEEITFEIKREDINDDNLLRFDPVDRQAYVEIKEAVLEIVNSKSEDVVSIPFESSNIQYSNNIILIDNMKELKFIAFNNDPQLFLKINETLFNSDSLKLKIRIRMMVDFNLTPYYRENFILNLSLQEEKDQRIIEMKDLVERQLNEIETLSSQMEIIKGEILEQSLLNESLKKKEEHLNGEILELEELLQKKDSDINLLLLSASWRYTAPLRKVMRFIRGGEGNN